MSKTHMPTKALICYCPCQPDQPIPHVDFITQKGCSGRLALEGQAETTVKELLGLYGTDDKDLKSMFKKRFSDTSLAVLSNCKSTKKMAMELNSFQGEIQSIEQIQSLLSKSTFDIIFMDLSEFDNAWGLVHQLISIEDGVDYIQCVISPKEYIIDKETHQFDSIIPRQSYLSKDGSTLSSINQDVELTYAYYHSGSGRTDDAQHYNNSSNNNKILAWHFLAEIGHKLGYVPKYGA